MNERLEDIVAGRRAKLQGIIKAGIDPYPSKTHRTHSNQQTVADFDNLLGQSLTLVGRIRSWRDMGKIIFAHIDDGTAKFQVLFKKDGIGDASFKFLMDNLDIGDFLEATGTLFKTKTEEKTLQASSYKLLAKSLLPLPSEHFGLADQEIKLRQRYLDILLNPETKDIFVKKAKFWSSFRQFLANRGFLELEMPVLEAIPGGAEAEPFVTHHNALDRDFYLRISLELPLKKMLVAGYEKVFEIGRIFRNEGIDTEHLQDYTQLEFYWAYASFEDLMNFSQEMYQFVIKETYGTLERSYQGKTINWGGTWPRLDYFELFKKHTGLDLNNASIDELKSFAAKNHISFEQSHSKGRLIDLIFKKKIRPLPEVSEQPAFLINQPVEIEPLAKRDPSNSKAVQRMQILACGSELGKGFGELNDPIDQRVRLEEQMKLREAGDKEAQFIDFDYLEAMEYGMPPCAGFGISERLFAVLNDRSIRETVIFPPMKSGSGATQKSKDTKIAVAVINKAAKLQPWQELNTIAHLNAEFGIHQGKKLLLQEEIETKDGKKIKLNPQHAIMIKTAATNQELQKLSAHAKSAGLEVSEFTREMIETTDDKKVIAQTKEKKLSEIEFLGILVFGNKNEIEKLTRAFELYK